MFFRRGEARINVHTGLCLDSIHGPTGQFPGWQGAGATFAGNALDPLMLAKLCQFDYDEHEEAMSWGQE